MFLTDWRKIGKISPPYMPSFTMPMRVLHCGSCVCMYTYVDLTRYMYMYTLLYCVVIEAEETNLHCLGSQILLSIGCLSDDDVFQERQASIVHQYLNM